MDEIKPREFSKPYLRAKSKEYMKKSIRFFLRSLDKNWIEISRVSGFFSKIWRELEVEDVCYLKRMKNGRLYVFREKRCCRSDQMWKDCPRYDCPIWPCDRDLACPYDKPRQDPDTLPIKPDVEIVFDDSEQEKQPDAHQEDSPE